MKRIESLLSREIGLSARSIGSSAVEAAVKLRLRACGALEVSEYLARLERDPSERSALVEEIVVPETWFFRDDEVFKALRRHAAKWLSRDKPLRVLSLPCATGEETYSVSITLLEAGLRASRYGVRGIDVSERALDLARRAEYGKNSFRGGDALQQRQRSHFEASGEKWRVVDGARDAVSFARGNVLDASLCAPRSFDVILCRNLLIYLDPDARARALDNLHGWLESDGLLFGGHAEALELMDGRFRRLRESSPFAYVKQRRSERPRKAAPDTPLARPATATRTASRKKAAGAKAASADAEPRALLASLERATELADLGNLEEARRVCERVIAEAGASSQAYYLLGIVDKAAGNREEAIACFNKSVYLDPQHHEALLHLALLHEERGEHTAAANFKRRAERARRGQAK